MISRSLSVVECGIKIYFDRHLQEDSRCAPSLKREFGICDESMSYEVRASVEENTLEVFWEHLLHC